MNDNMQKYIGTKRINAMPMTRLEYNLFRGWELPEDEDGSDEGYLVEYIDGGKSNTEEFAGYVSWSPSEVFNRAYCQTKGLAFGEAVEALKVGMKVTRDGWNGKGMFLYYVPANSYQAQTEAARSVFGGMVPYRDYIAMKTVNDEVVPWVASQSDLLEADWVVVD